MTSSSPRSSGRGRATGPSRPDPRATVLVTSADAARRCDWGERLEAQGDTVLRCAGPLVSCALLAGGTRCPLLEEADVAIYDVESLSEPFTRRLVETYPDVPVLFARDGIAADGRHRPLVDRLARGSGDASCAHEVCFGRLASV